MTPMWVWRDGLCGLEMYVGDGYATELLGPRTIRQTKTSTMRKEESIVEGWKRDERRAARVVVQVKRAS